MKIAISVCISIALMLLCGCRPNATIGQILSSGTDGSADDDAGNPDQYRGPAKTKATDGQTDASSIAPLFNKVGGSVHAIPFNGPARRDQALAISNNKVVSELTVNKADNLTFNLELNLQAPNVTKHGKLEIQLSAFVLDSNGRTVNDPQGNPVPPIFSGKFSIEPDAQGKPTVTLPGGAGTEPLDANGNYVRDLKGPNQGIPLQPGNYQLKLELNIIGSAPAGQGTAVVDSATATINIR